MNKIDLPTQDELFEMARDYCYNKCSLQNFFDEDEIIIIMNHWCSAYTEAIRKFVDSDYKGLD